MWEIRKEVESIYDYMVDLRRDFHMYPETSFKEIRTAEKISKELEAMGISYRRVLETGIVAEIKGEKPGKTVALRADIDALEISEVADVEFKSKNEGVMHACGHDLHAASLLGAIKVINKMKNDLCGTVKFIFQPGEETVTGAPKMMEADPFMDDVDAVFAIHNMPDLEVGNVYVKDGGMMFAGEGFKIIVRGLSGHGSTPHLAKDALLAASSIVVDLQKIASTEIDSRDPAVVTVGQLSSGTRWNIIANYAEMAGTYRCYSKEAEKRIKEAMVRIAENTARAYGTEAEVIFSMYVPAVINSPDLGRIVRESAKKINKDTEKYVEFNGLTSSDDFSYFTSKVPGYYALVGSGVEDKSKRFSIHSPNVVMNEKALEVSAALYAQFAIDFLDSK